MITILGLDQSLTCSGVVVLDVMPHMGRREPHIDVDFSGSIKTEKSGDDYILDTLKRGNQIVKQLEEIVADHSVQVICFESLSLASKGNATRTLPMLLGIILNGLSKLIKERGIEIYHVAPMALKKLATGKGNSGKEAMFEQLQFDCPNLYDKLSVLPKNVGRYDITDAFYLAREGYNLHLINKQEK